MVCVFILVVIFPLNFKCIIHLFKFSNNLRQWETEINSVKNYISSLDGDFPKLINLLLFHFSWPVVCRTSCPIKSTTTLMSSPTSCCRLTCPACSCQRSYSPTMRRYSVRYTQRFHDYTVFYFFWVGRLVNYWWDYFCCKVFFVIIMRKGINDQSLFKDKMNGMESILH